MKIAIVVMLAGCGAGARERNQHEGADFDCKQRSVTYTAAHSISGDEIGVLLDCAQGPHIKRWRVDKSGKRLEDGRPMSPMEFDDLWTQVEGTGWRNLGDCGNGSLDKNSPVYAFEVRDESDQKRFSCQAPTMPYPYNDIVDPLNLAAQQGKSQLGDDEPADAKALDKKGK